MNKYTKETLFIIFWGILIALAMPVTALVFFIKDTL